MTAQQSSVDGDTPDGDERRATNHGKENVAVCRTYVTSLEGVRTIPESSFDGQDSVLFGLDVRMQVGGREFLPSFSEGDNTKVMAADPMKNFILHHADGYDGVTLEGFLEFIGSGSLDIYPQMSAVEVSTGEIRFGELPAPRGDGDEYETSDLVFRVSDNESGYDFISLARNDGAPVITDQASGVTDLELVKVEGSSSTNYTQDEYMTLPGHGGQTFCILLDILWGHDDPEDVLGEGPKRYVPSEQVHDITHVVFDEVDPDLIQDLIYQTGLCVLEHYPQLASVRFETNNHIWFSVRDDLDGGASVLWRPSVSTGFRQFSTDRGDPDEQ